MHPGFAVALFVTLFASSAFAYDPIPRRLPARGQPIPAEPRAELEKQLAALPATSDPDVEIYTKAVRFALEFNEFYKLSDDLQKARSALAEAQRRETLLTSGRSDWRNRRGLLVRGYRSTVDGSAQPFGLEIPETLDLSKPVPLYVWLHGRGDANTDLHFIDDRTPQHWPFASLLDDGIVLHPFGRQCVGYKSAGEIDVLDAVDHVIANYNVDPARIALMGFSMGGAGAWHLGAHYPDRWAVVHAGAGFVDVKRYQKLGPDQMPSAVEQTLWGLYDVPNYARNLLNLPLVAYSGEKDKQKDAADFMSEVFARNGKTLPHIVGKEMGHKYDDESKEKVAAFVKKALATPKNRTPGEIHLQTRTLRYNKCAWIEITGLEKHWEDARVDATVRAPGRLLLTTRNVTSFLIRRDLPETGEIRIDGHSVKLPHFTADVHLVRDETGQEWNPVFEPVPGLRKRPGLQGPIDDAFLAPFLVVTPSGKSKDPALDQWVDFELAHFKTRWRALFRGDLRVKSATEVTKEDARNFNLILFGTPESNKHIADFLPNTPLSWPAGPNRVLLAIYPNPAAPHRYVVLNSGPTFREAHDRTNSLQNPKLGDWAVIDLSEPPGPERPGKIVQAGFFDEEWKLE